MSSSREMHSSLAIHHPSPFNMSLTPSPHLPPASLLFQSSHPPSHHRVAQVSSGMPAAAPPILSQHYHPHQHTGQTIPTSRPDRICVTCNDDHPSGWRRSIEKVGLTVCNKCGLAERARAKKQANKTGSPGGDHYTSSDDSTTKAVRECFVCHVTSSAAWRTSTHHPGHTVCNRCGLRERKPREKSQLHHEISSTTQRTSPPESYENKSASHSHQASSAPIRECSNCGATASASWRRSVQDPSRMLCNKCGLRERKIHKAPARQSSSDPYTLPQPSGGSSAQHQPQQGYSYPHSSHHAHPSSYSAYQQGYHTQANGSQGHGSGTAMQQSQAHGSGPEIGYAPYAYQSSPPGTNHRTMDLTLAPFMGPNSNPHLPYPLQLPPIQTPQSSHHAHSPPAGYLPNSSARSNNSKINGESPSPPLQHPSPGKKCFNCKASTTTAWRSSVMYPGQLVCDKCGVAERRQASGSTDPVSRSRSHGGSSAAPSDNEA